MNDTSKLECTGNCNKHSGGRFRSKESNASVWGAVQQEHRPLGTPVLVDTFRSVRNWVRGKGQLYPVGVWRWWESTVTLSGSSLLLLKGQLLISLAY